MAYIQTTNGLTDTDFWKPNPMNNSLNFYDGFNYDYSTIYRTQPNVRVCVDFLSRNVAQLGLHVYRLKDNNDRERVRNHPLAKVLNKPLPESYKVTRYRLIESLMADLGIYFNAYWLKIKTDSKTPNGLLRIPPNLVTVKGGLAPTEYEIYLGGETKKFKPEEIVHFRGYNADNPIMGLSPLETLRRTLAEDNAAAKYQEKFWQNSARFSGIIERPKDAPLWNDESFTRFKVGLENLYSGSDNSGKIAVLEDGMVWKQTSFNAEESQYIESRKLSREECARAYHIPPTLVGILDKATFSNVTEQHKMLYTDTLGPWLAMIEQEIELQLMPEFEDVDDIYVEFNIQEKLSGDFEQQAQSYQASVGRPWMTANEARAKNNMPRIDGGDELVTPLNVLVGGQASLLDSAPKADEIQETKSTDTAEIKAEDTNEEKFSAELPEQETEFTGKWNLLMNKHFVRQRQSILSKLVTKSEAGIQAIYDSERWNRELSEDMWELNVENIMVWAEFLAEQLGVTINRDEVRLWAQKNATIAAERINQTTLEQLILASAEDDRDNAFKRVFENAIGSRAWQIALSRLNILKNFGMQYVAERSGFAMKKTWNLGLAETHRDSHVSLDGVTIGINERFSNGMKYPCDVQNGTADDIAGCRCYLTYSK